MGASQENLQVRIRPQFAANVSGLRTGPSAAQSDAEGPVGRRPGGCLRNDIGEFHLCNVTEFCDIEQTLLQVTQPLDEAIPIVLQMIESLKILPTICFFQCSLSIPLFHVLH